MKRTIIVGAMLCLASCNGTGEAPKPVASSAPSAAPVASAAPAKKEQPADLVRQGSVLALAVEDDALFIADEDRETVRALALPARVKSARGDVHMPGRPAQVLATPGRVLVTIRQIDRGEGALLILERKQGLELAEVARVALPVDAWGIALTPDAKTALVTSAWSHKLSAVDLDKRAVRWSVDVAREPRGVIAIAGDRAYVSHLTSGDATRVDGVSAKEPSVKRVDFPASPMRSPYKTKLDATLGYSIAASAEGDKLYFARHALGSLGGDAWAGEGTVDVLATATDTIVAPARGVQPVAHFVEDINDRIKKNEAWGLGGVGVAIDAQQRLSTPRAIVYRKKTRTVLVVAQGNDLVAELDADALDPTLVDVRAYGTARKVDTTLGVAEHGEAPEGIALSADEDVAYVYCRATNDIVVFDLPPDASGYRSAPHAAIPLGPEEDKHVRVGRALFYDASNSVLSTGMACAGCHPEGRDDGHVWHEAKITLKPPPSNGSEPREDHFTNFFATGDVSAIRARWGEISAEGDGGFGYARQTPIIAGRVKAVGPYGWHGESADLTARIVAGFGLHRWQGGSDNETMKRVFANELTRFVREGLVPPPHVDRPPTDEEKRGKEVFTSAATKCSTCHPPQTDYTDRSVVSLKKINPPKGFAEDPTSVYKVPSLLYVGGSTPYMHDGRFETLESLIEYNQDRMGSTSQLSAEDRKALIAFLRTL